MKKSKKILYAASTASHLRRFHMPYIEALRENAEVSLMATGEGVDFPITFDKHYFSLANFRSLLEIRKILKREQFDLLILNTTLTAFWIRAALFGMRKRPYVLNIVHGYLFPLERGGLRKQILLLCEKLMKGKTDTIAVMNGEDLETAKQNKLCKGDVYFTYGMGLPDGYAEKEIHDVHATYAPDGQFLCTFVGELSRRKNQIFLVQAVERLKSQGIPIRLLLVGEGSEHDTLKAEIERLGLENDVLLLGHSDEVPSILTATDLYLSASESEGLPFNLMEAMAFGLPIVASDVRGQRDLLTQKPEMLYPAGDMDAFCKAVTAVYQSEKKGSGGCSYPELEQYQLRSVFEDNMKILTMGLE